MAHLGEEISALVDGQLPPERTEAALAHLVRCPGCAAQVAAERASRRRIAEARDVAPSAELTDRLLRLRAEGCAPWGLRDRARQPFTSARVRRRLALRTSLALAGAAGVTGALVVVGSVTERTGDPTAMLAQVSGPEQTGTQLMVSAQNLRSAGAGSTTDAALEWLRTHGWVAPTRLPEGVRITYVGTATSAAGEELAEVDLLADGQPVRVLQQRGVLDVSALAGLQTVPVGQWQAYAVPGPQAALVLQADDVSVLVLAPQDDVAHAVAASFPVTAPGTDVATRLDQGWETVVAWTDLLFPAE